MASDKKVMGEFNSRIVSRILLWFTFAAMAAAAVALFYTLF
jgi:Mn2+/Fe2+ NRAMP family transporter